MPWLAIFLGLVATKIMATSYPNICDLVNSHRFRDVLGYGYHYTTCGSPIPRPCARFSYYVPKYFIEVVQNSGESYFRTLPGVEAQLGSLPSEPPVGTVDDHGAYSAQAHVIRVPFASWAFQGMPCSGEVPDLFCFSVMSEHLGSGWKTGSPDLWQPKFLAWSSQPKACLLKGAATSATGSWSGGIGQDSGSCSFPTSWLRRYPPSTQPVCTGWGIHFPRSGTVTSSDTTTASLVIASRIKSLGTEVFKNISASPDERWHMVLPQMSSWFREGQNVAFLRVRGVSEGGRLLGLNRNYLYAIWQKTTCKRDIPVIWTTEAWITGLQAACGAIQ